MRQIDSFIQFRITWWLLISLYVTNAEEDDQTKRVTLKSAKLALAAGSNLQRNRKKSKRIKRETEKLDIRCFCLCETFAWLHKPSEEWFVVWTGRCLAAQYAVILDSKIAACRWIFKYTQHTIQPFSQNWYAKCKSGVE